MKDKVMSLDEAIRKFVNNGDTVFLGGFAHNEPYAAAHEIIRQKKRDLTLTKAVGGIIYDQLIGAGCAKRVIASHVWNYIGPRPAYAWRRAVEQQVPHAIETEEETVFSITMRYFAGALNLPFMPIRSIMGTDIIKYSIPAMGEKAKIIECPFTGERICLVASLKPDVGILQAQRVDPYGNTQVWGVMGDTIYGMNASKKVIVCAEEIVDTETIRSDPDRTIIPEFRVSAVVEEPWGAHPGYMQGYYDRDFEHYVMYCEMTKTLEGFEKYLSEWVYGVSNRKEYMKKLGVEKLSKLKAKSLPSSPVNYGY